MHLSIPGSPWRIPPGKPPWPSNQQPTPGFNLGGGANPGQIGSVDKDNQPTPRMDTCMLPPPTARRPPLEHAFVRHEGPTRVPRGSPLGSPRKISQRIPWGISQAPLRGSTRGILQGTPGDPPVTLRPPPWGIPRGIPLGDPPRGSAQGSGGAMACHDSRGLALVRTCVDSSPGDLQVNPRGGPRASPEGGSPNPVWTQPQTARVEGGSGAVLSGLGGP